MSVNLVVSDFKDYDELEFDVANSDFDTKLILNLENKKLEELLNSKEIFLKCMKKNLNEIESFKEEDLKDYCSKIIEQWKYIYDNFNNLIDKINFVILDLKNEDCLNFLKRNPILKNKKIVLPINVGINEIDKIKELITKYAEYDIYIPLDNNTNYISLEDCKKTMNEIDKQASKIKKLNLSPMETILYVYDIVKSRIYKEEDIDEEKYKSRDLSEVLFSNKIVCVGYSNIFSALLNYIGIKTFSVELESIDNNYGHQRNVIYIKDLKYNIDGVYYFDATWDSKKDSEDNEFINYYEFFAKTKIEMDEYDNINQLNCIDKRMQKYSVDLTEKYLNIMLNNVNPKKNDDEKLEQAYYARTIAYMENIVYGCSDFQSYLNINNFDLKTLRVKIDDLVEKFNKKIPAEVYLKVLNEVRKVQSRENEEIYSLKNLYNAYIFSNWSFKEPHYSKEEFMLHMIFDKKIDANHSEEDNFRNYMMPIFYKEKQKTLKK